MKGSEELWKTRIHHCGDASLDINERLDWLLEALNLDESTTVDPGDYLALYTDLNSGTPEYGEITKSRAEWYGLYPGISDGFFRRDAGGYGCVSEGPGGRRRSVRRNRPGNLEEQIQVQAMESGFAQDVADRIGAAAIATDSFEELEPLWRKNLVRMFLWNIQTKIRVTKQKKKIL